MGNRPSRARIWINNDKNDLLSNSEYLDRQLKQLRVTDRTSDFNQFSSVARQAGLNVPSAIAAEHDKTRISRAMVKMDDAKASDAQK